MTNSVPQGRLKVAQDASPGVAIANEPVPQGRLRISQDMVLGWLPESRKVHSEVEVPQDCILGIFSRPCGTGSLAIATPGLASWATLSRPSGTEYGERSSHADSKVLIVEIRYGSAKAVP
jgi:hypothetical protein